MYGGRQIFNRDWRKKKNSDCLEFFWVKCQFTRPLLAADGGRKGEQRKKKDVWIERIFYNGESPAGKHSLFVSCKLGNTVM